MVTQSFFVSAISQEEYDEFLAGGWFRDSMMMYRSDLVVLDSEVLDVVHIRSVLDGLVFRPGQRRLMKKVERRFRVTIGSPNLTEAHSRLYFKHMKRFRGFVHSALSDFLYRAEDDRIPLGEVSVYDGDRLVAVSFFDIGRRSMASLLGLFDPDYESYSLGYYTMLKEAEWGIENGKEFYYPGYVFDLPTAFDYKLRIGNIETLAPLTGWMKGLRRPVSEYAAGLVVRERIKELGHLLSNRGIEFTRRLYPHFTAARMMNMDNSLFLSPVYLEIEYSEVIYAACYEPAEDSFVLKQIEPSRGLHGLINMPLSLEYMNNPIYETRLMKVVSSVPIFTAIPS